MEQTISEHEFGQCPACGSECVTEETTWDILLRKIRRLIYKVRGKL